MEMHGGNQHGSPYGAALLMKAYRICLTLFYPDLFQNQSHCRTLYLMLAMKDAYLDSNIVKLVLLLVVR